MTSQHNTQKQQVVTSQSSFFIHPTCKHKFFFALDNRSLLLVLVLGVLQSMMGYFESTVYVVIILTIMKYCM